MNVLRFACFLCLAAACSKEQPATEVPTQQPAAEQPLAPEPSPSAVADPEPPAEAPSARATTEPSAAPSGPPPSPDDCAGVIAAVNADVVREVLQRHGFSRDFSEDHSRLEADQLEPGSDSVDTTRYSACASERRCISVSTTTTGDPRYPNRCSKGYDHIYGHAALGIGRDDLAVMVISTEDEATEDELRAQQARILDELITTISN